VTAYLLIASLLACVIGAVLAIVLPARPRMTTLVMSASAGLASLLALITGLILLLGKAAAPVIALPSALPFGPLLIQPDGLSAWFLVVIGFVGVAVAFYSPGYLQAHAEPNRLRFFAALFNAMLLTLFLIVIAGDGVLFLIAWETMAWVSYLLVNYEYEDASTVHASYQMLVVSEIGTVGLIAAFLLLGAPSGRLDFASLRQGASALSPALRNAVFVAALFGFGAKAALLPLQLWLPDAHTAALSNISALLSAVITKLGLYGIARFAFDLLGVGPPWWGVLMFELGVATAFVGILYSLVQIDLKRVLAYSTIENCGFVLIGLGLAQVFRARGLLALAAISMIAAFYHVINHASYKSLLFLGAGAVDRGSGTRSLALLGGLVRRMPWTAAFFLLGSLAIGGVPPLNGYISEWMTLEVMLRTSEVPQMPERVAIAVVGPFVALTAGLVVTAFVRAFALTFVGMPRSRQAETAHEVSRGMHVGMGILALGCVFLGVLPTFVLPVIDRVSMPLLGVSVADKIVPPLFTGHPGEYAPLVGLGGSLFHRLPVNGLVVIAAPALNTITAPTYLAIAEGLLIGLLLLALSLIRPLGHTRVGPVWAGGIPRFAPQMQYTALAYSNPVRLIFNGLYRSTHQFEAERPAARHMEGVISYAQRIPEPLEREVYSPVRKLVANVSRAAQIIQSGSVNQYVFYIFAIVLIILVLRVIR
jgi:hydrogenase-4 component B